MIDDSVGAVNRAVFPLTHTRLLLMTSLLRCSALPSFGLQQAGSRAVPIERSVMPFVLCSPIALSNARALQVARLQTSLQHDFRALFNTVRTRLNARTERAQTGARAYPTQHA